MQWLTLFIKVLPIVLEIVRALQHYQLTQEAEKEVLDDLKTNADLLVAKAALARSSVPDDADSVRSDPANRDNRQA